MSNVIEVDFAGAPPAQGAGADLIPRGHYALKCVAADKVKARSGSDMVSVRFTVLGPTEKGARLRDQFVFPRTRDASKYGLQRFNAFLEAVTGEVIGEKKIKLDLDDLVGKTVEADVVDGKYEPPSGGPTRDVSNIDSYQRMRGTSRPEPNGTAASTIAVEDEMVDEAEELAEPEEEPRAPTRRPAARRQSPPPAELDEAADETDDLFS